MMGFSTFSKVSFTGNYLVRIACLSSTILEMQ